MKKPKAKLILYVVSGSGSCKAAEDLLKEKGVEFEKRDITGSSHKWGFGKLPVLTTIVENNIFAEGLYQIEKVLKK